MPQTSSSQPSGSRAPGGTNGAGFSRRPARSDGLFLGTSPPSNSTPISSSQPSSSRLERALATERKDDQAAKDRSAARKAARRKRKEYEPYQKAATSSISTSNTASAPLSSQPVSRANQPAAPDRSKATNAQLPPSTAPALSRDRSSREASSSTAKRKAQSPASQPSPTKRTRASRRQAARPPTPDDDSDDDFEIVGGKGPAFGSGSGEHVDNAPAIKASPSPVRALKASQPTQPVRLRRSQSRGTASGRPSPAVPSSPSLTGQDQSAAAAHPASQASSNSRNSRASSEMSSASSTESKERELERIQSAQDAFKRGTTFADQIIAVTREFTTTLTDEDADLGAIEEFRRKIASLGPRLQSRDIILARKKLPKILQRHLNAVNSAWYKHTKGDDSTERSNAGQNKLRTLESASSPSKSATSAAPMNAGPSADAPKRVEAPQHIADLGEPQQSSASRHGVNQSQEAGATTSSGFLKDTSRADSDAALVGTDETVGVGLKTTVDSADSEQAYETPLDEPSEASNADRHQDAVEPPQTEPEDPERGAPAVTDSTATTEEQPEPEQPSHPVIEEESEGEEEGNDADEQEQRQPDQVGEPDEMVEEEDELADEHTGDEPADASSDSAIATATAPEAMGEYSHVDTGDNRQDAGASSPQAPDISIDADQPSSSTNDSATNDEQPLGTGQDDPSASASGNVSDHAAQPVLADAANSKAVVTDEEEAANADAAGPAEAQPSEETEGTRTIAQQDGAQVELQMEPLADSHNMPQVEQQDDRPDHHREAQPTEQKEQDHIDASEPPQGDAPANEQVIEGTGDMAAVDPEPAVAESFDESFTGGVNTPIDASTEQVATAVEAVEQALAAASETFSPEAVDASISVQGAHSAAEDPMKGAHSAAGDPAQGAKDGAAPAGDNVPAEAAAANPAPEIVTDATSSPSPSSQAAEDDAVPQVAATLADEERPNASVEEGGVPALLENGVSEQAASTATAGPVAELHDTDMPAHDDVTSMPKETQAPPLPDFAAARVDPPPVTTEETSHAEEPTTTAAPAAAESQVNAPPAAEPERRQGREISQTASDSTPTSRPKRTIEDGMRSLLGGLAGVTGRSSSYKTIQKLKPLRAGFSTPETVSDLVQHWQDPAKMIPWTCLQELGPAIFHKNAHRHMHISMHELMDKVSSTRSVTHLLEKLPERVMTRALMEFPRVPHMLHCWNEEKNKYYASRGMPQPTDTKPEFRFADRGEESGVARGTRASAPPSSIDSPMQLEVADRKPVPIAAPPMTPSYSAAGSASQHPSNLTNPAMGARAQMPQMLQVAQPQMLTEIGSSLLAAHLAQNQQRAQASVVDVQRAREHAIETQRAHLAAAAAAAQARRAAQQPTIRQAFQQQTSQTRAGPEQLHQMQQAQLLQAQQAQQMAHIQAAQHHQQALQHQQTQQLHQLSATRQAAMVKTGTESIFADLAADCLSFAEHVIGSRGSSEVNLQRHFSEADVLHVVGFVVNTYRRECEEQAAAGHDASKARERLEVISRVRNAAVETMALTHTLCKIKMCLNEAVFATLRRTGAASTAGWLELLRTSERWKGVRDTLLVESPGWGMLNGKEVEMMLQRQVEVVNKRLEEMLERLVGVDEMVGVVQGTGEEREAHEGMRKECEQIGLICCKHVVGILVGEPEQSSAATAARG
ncbi:hypothetical protein PSEUBRA_003285 [Kalmanozyma brasiliensis GHG001]|uniref:uncharacterized protein n=1 Tax=Kalmanozyma brasiliensis (strain GHG001) TaxID=1365824 RepID=UPI002867E240|nr:uncharacterized protein PSEUBRA_003285 [Kalmanozyma brasiliensis GHG001]KAF6767214.1 hypothetical protein PSEUBRA_003285 [Kalmanozyma brasiliensis GHG001]